MRCRLNDVPALDKAICLLMHQRLDHVAAVGQRLCHGNHDYRPGKSPRYKTADFHTKHLRNVTVGSEERVFVFNERASPVTVYECFHFREVAKSPDDRERVRAFCTLSKTRRRSNKSGSVRRYEAHPTGLTPERPIKDIQNEHGKEAGKNAWRMPACGKAFDPMIAKGIAARGDATQTDTERRTSWPTRDDRNYRKASPVEPSDDVASSPRRQSRSSPRTYTACDRSTCCP